MYKESEHVREVFAYYGLALYLAQCFEKCICILLSGQYAPTSPEKMTRWRYDELLDGHMQLSFGKLINKLKSVMELTPAFEEDLRKAVQTRNLLAHNYWWERAVDFMTLEGRERMLLELKDFVNEFEQLNNIFDALQQNWMEAIGFPIQSIDLEKLKKQITSEKEDEQVRRRLRKRELLVNVYTYLSVNNSGEPLEIPIFEFEDGTLWTLCDCGLTYAPPYVDKAILRSALVFQKALPANFNPRPKGAMDWDYRLSLDTGFYIQVLPSWHDGKFAFRWQIKNSNKAS